MKNKEPGVKLMGFGHRVYKNYDPRAAIVKKTADEVLGKLGGNNELLDLAMQLEEIALADDYFVERKLYPNVDFYTGLIYKAMGFPTRMFTVLFALGRLPGLDRPVARDDQRPGHQDRPAAAGLHRRHRAATTWRSTTADPTAGPAIGRRVAMPARGAPDDRSDHERSSCPPPSRWPPASCSRPRTPAAARRITEVEFVVSTEDGGELRIPLVHRHGAWWAP